MRTLAIHAAVRVAIKGDIKRWVPPVWVCVPCGSSHGDWFPGPNYPSHGRLELTPYELDLALRLAAAIRAERLTLAELELAAKRDDDLEELMNEVRCA
jgi:hypothetical protein